jgi:hypothetical protein
VLDHPQLVLISYPSIYTFPCGFLCTVIVRQPLIPTAHCSDDPLFRQPIALRHLLNIHTVLYSHMINYWIFCFNESIMLNWKFCCWWLLWLWIVMGKFCGIRFCVISIARSSFEYRQEPRGRILDHITEQPGSILDKMEDSLRNTT